MLTNEQKAKLVERRLLEYHTRLFNLEMDRTALEAIGDSAGVEAVDQRIAALRKAYAAVKGMS